jgi:hypothetical protein
MPVVDIVMAGHHHEARRCHPYGADTNILQGWTRTIDLLAFIPTLCC